MIVRLTLVNQDPGATADAAYSLWELLMGNFPLTAEEHDFGVDDGTAWAWVEAHVAGPVGATRLLASIEALGQQVRVEVAS